MTELPSIHLTVVQPAGYVHSLGFVDQARYVRHQLRRFGVDVTLAKNRLRVDAVNIVFGAHLGFDPALRNRFTCLFFNLEQLGSAGASVNSEYLDLLRTSAVIDYDAANVPAFCANAADVPIVPFLYAPYLDASGAAALEDRPIDLLFIGSLNDRRRRWLKRVEDCGATVSMLDRPIYGPERDHWICQSKAVLNCSFYETGRFEQARASHCLSLGTPVISERHPNSCPPDAFEEAVFWLGDSELESFFANAFGRPDFFDDARARLAHFRLHDPVEAYADLMAFAAGFIDGHRKTVDLSTPWAPAVLQVGCAMDYSPGFLNIDTDPANDPDLEMDLSMPLALPLRSRTTRGFEVCLAAGTLDRIIAGDAPARAADLPTLMTNALVMLREGGRLEIAVPSRGADTDPRALRSFSDRSIRLFTDDFWKLGWMDHRFELVELMWCDDRRRACDQASSAMLAAVLVKRATTPHERMLARTARADFGGIPDDTEAGAGSSTVLPEGEALSMPARAAIESIPIPASSPRNAAEERPGPLAVAMDEQASAVDALIDTGRFNDAMTTIAEAVHGHFILPGVAHHSLFYPRLDHQVRRLADTMASQTAPLKPGKALKENHLIIATELYGIGGHSKVIEELARELRNPILVLTDLFGGAARDPQQAAWIETAYSMAQVVWLPPGTLWQKATELHGFVRQLRPASIWHFNHHQDPVGLVATLGLKGSRQLFVHHCDHNPGLGATVPTLHHVDITTTLQQTCSCHLGRTSALLKLYVADRGVKDFPASSVRGSDYSVVTAGRLGKFSENGPFALGEMVATTLATIGGRHYHIGPLPDAWRGKVNALLARRHIDPTRFVPLGAVPSLWETMKELDASFYIGSAPVSGGRGGVEAQGCGYPVLPFTGFEAGSLLADYSSYADANGLGWASLAELSARLAGLGDRHQALSTQARGFYEAEFSRSRFARCIGELLSGSLARS